MKKNAQFLKIWFLMRNCSPAGSTSMKVNNGVTSLAEKIAISQSSSTQIRLNLSEETWLLTLRYLSLQRSFFNYCPLKIRSYKKFFSTEY